MNIDEIRKKAIIKGASKLSDLLFVTLEQLSCEYEMKIEGYIGSELGDEEYEDHQEYEEIDNEALIRYTIVFLVLTSVKSYGLEQKDAKKIVEKFIRTLRAEFKWRE